MAKSYNKWGKLGKSGKKLEKWIYFCKMAAGGHFGCPKITFDRISRHFRSIRNFYFLNFFQNGRRPPFCTILDDRKSLSITFLTISDQYATFFFFEFFFQNGRQRPFWKSDLRQKQ